MNRPPNSRLSMVDPAEEMCLSLSRSKGLGEGPGNAEKSTWYLTEQRMDYLATGMIGVIVSQKGAKQ